MTAVPDDGLKLPSRLAALAACSVGIYRLPQGHAARSLTLFVRHAKHP